jgi:nitroreductase
MENTTMKVNDVAHPVHDLVRRRWSPRAFSSRAVERETLLSVLEAARWAPSSFNAQPWSFLVATQEDPAGFERMLNCLVPQNQAWAKAAPVLMIAVAKTHFEHNGKPNRHALYDTGQAVAFLTLQATALDLYVHQMAGFSAGQAREAYAIPAGAEPVAAIALGYLGEPDSLPEGVRERELVPGKRRPLSEFVFGERWGEPAALARK